MSQVAETLQFPQQVQPQRPDAEPRTPLERLEREVRQDAKHEPEAFLEESEVPAGGE